MVKVEYKTPYNHIFKKENDKIGGKTLKEIVEKIEKKYEDKPMASTIWNAFVSYGLPGEKKESLSIKSDLEYKVEPKGTLYFTWMIAGG